eukprot:scaffold15094_cov223-Skeletonema_dohrnii-CCMP3373.AAC.2
MYIPYKLANASHGYGTVRLQVDAHFLRLTCRLFERAHALGLAGVLTAMVMDIDILGERGTKGYFSGRFQLAWSRAQP